MLLRSAAPFTVALVVLWFTSRSLGRRRRAAMLTMALPALLAVTFEEYSEQDWGVRSGADLTTLFNLRPLAAVPVSMFDLFVVAATITAVLTLGPAPILRILRSVPVGLGWLLMLALAAVVYGAGLGLARIPLSEDYELFHVLRESRPLILALVALFTVAIASSRDRAWIRPVACALVAGVMARATVGSVRHLTGAGRWYQGSRMVYFDSSDSVLFLAALGALVVTAVRVPRVPVRLLALFGAVPLLYAVVFSYRRSVWVGVLAALVGLCVLERRLLLARFRLIVVVGLLGFVVVGLGLTQTDRSFVVDRARSIFDLTEEPSNVFRVHDLRNGLHDIAAHRGLGAGFGGRVDVVSTGSGQEEFIEHAARTNHNTAVYLMMKMGVLGGGVWLVLLAATAIHGIRQLHSPVPTQRNRALVLAPVLVIAGVTSMFLPLAYNVRPMLLWGVAAGFLWTEASPAHLPVRPAGRSGPGVAPPRPRPAER